MSGAGAQGRPAPDAVYNRTDFSSAAAKYAALVAHDRRSGFPTSGDALSRHDDPYALSAAEIAIFGIDPDRAAALFWAYARYECMVGTVDEYFCEFVDAERQEFAAFDGAECFENAVGFMAASCRLPVAQCMGWVLKAYAADVRGGLYGVL